MILHEACERRDHLINVEVLNEKTSLAVLLQVLAIIESQGGP